ncbi:helix-turn-helix transcriptional regulator [Humitalea sp. 24SJ18S-53]|uniref:helix-turn-helix transcriptional regulator n=1 Tax=Humitalea sp. 24SJ18S-53 TaxID=3422307 RepID=UPI003D67E1DA
MPERHEKLSQALGLITALSATRAGLTMAQMQADLGCGRRTVERLLAAIRQACADVEEVATDLPEKRWRMRPSRLVATVRMTPEEIAEIEAAARRLVDEALPARAATLRSAANKLRASMDEGARRRAEPDVEALLAAEGLAARPGPRVAVPPGVIETLRHALLATHLVRISYLTANGAAREHLLEPYGLLYGARPYLLAAKPGKPDVAVWRLDRVRSVTETEEAFVPRPGFDIATLMKDSFGVWRESPMDVVLHFTAPAVEDALTWRFHGSQQAEPQPDGSLILRFSAGGIEEMAAHLAQWDGKVEVLAPPALRDRMARMGQALVKGHATRIDSASVRS